MAKIKNVVPYVVGVSTLVVGVHLIKKNIELNKKLDNNQISDGYKGRHYIDLINPENEQTKEEENGRRYIKLR